MAVNIGSVNCDIIDQIYAGSMERVNMTERLGIDGVCLQKLGAGPGRFAFRCLKFDSSANINTWRAALEALKGAGAKTAEDSAGDTYTKLHVLDVRAAQGWKSACIESGTSKYRGELIVIGIEKP